MAAKWRIYRESNNETILWWPWHEHYPYQPSGLMIEALFASIGSMDRALHYLRNARAIPVKEPFILEANDEHVKIGNSIYLWELEDG